MATQNTTPVAQVWSDFAHARLAPGTEGWRFAMDHPKVRSYIYDTYIGGRDPFGWALSEIAPDRQLVGLEVGCGGGDLAIGLAKSGRFSHIDAYDISDGAIKLAQDKAIAAGLKNIDFEVRDCNELTLSGKKYDFVYSSHALHHIESLEELFSQVNLVLKDDGVFFADDYIGPSRMQYSDYHLDLINAVFEDFPPAKRRDAWYGDVVKARVDRIPIEDYLRIDPSEGVRAADIVTVMAQNLFTRVYPMGMSIAYEALNGVVRNFDPSNDYDNKLIDSIIESDKKAAADSAVPVCFAMLVGYKNVKQ